MLNQKQLNYLASLPEMRLIEFLQDKSVEYLQDIKADVKSFVKPENPVSKNEREQYLTILSCLDAKIAGLQQKNPISNDTSELADLSNYDPLTSANLIEILGLTIKKDNENKLITFLCLLSAYTQDSQFNLSFNAPSSSGKSYIPTEIAGLFPKEDVLEVGYCSPTAFFHDKAKEYKKETNELIVDLSHKILIFLDQPHTLLLQHLRPILSHDKKEIRIKITDKSQRAGLRTKNINLIGFPSVIFCTAGLNVDEQESTRFLLLSPEINQEKIREAIQERIKRSADTFSYSYSLETHILRKQLKERIKAIKQADIPDILIKEHQKVENMFFERIKILKPRHQRDIGRVISLIKVFALLNLWSRERDGSSIIVSDSDIDDGFKLYDVISESQELNLPPYVFDLYKRVIIPIYKEKNPDGIEIGTQGIARKEVMKKHYQIFGRLLPLWQLRQEIIPMLETAGLITQEPDPLNKRLLLMYPTTSLTVSDTRQYGEVDGGVTSDETQKEQEVLI